MVDSLVIMDERHLERLVGKTKWSKMFQVGVTSGILSIDLFILVYDLAWLIDEFTIYVLVSLTTIILVWDIIGVILHYKKKQETILKLLEQPIVKEVMIREQKQAIKTVWEIKWKNLIIFLFVIGISLLIYFGIFGGGW